MKAMTMSSDNTLTAEFDLATGEHPAIIASDIVTRKGKIFEAGDYPDKQFAITPEELAAAAADFKPVPLDLEHRSTVLDGRLGELSGVELSEDGRTLYGSVALPRWLDSLLDEGKRKVSCTWDRATKRLQGLALVNQPRITDAVLMAAFTADFEGRRNSSADMAAIQTIHDHCAQLGAECASSEYSVNQNQAGTQPQLKEFKKTMSDINTEKDTSQPDNTALTAEFATMRAELEKLKSANEALKAENRRTAAAAFADAEIKAGRAYPAEKAAMVAAFEQAAKDDDAAPATITFAEGQSGSRVDALKALYAARPASSLMNGGQRIELSADQVHAAFGSTTRQSNGGGQEVSKERVEELKGMTPLGIAAKNN